jgi:type IV pilus assembly protein PilX
MKLKIPVAGAQCVDRQAKSLGPGVRRDDEREGSRHIGGKGSVRNTQRGFALLMALIFLVLLSMLAIAASQRSLLQERMAGSFRNAQQARMSAETALRGAEYKLWSLASQAGARLHCQQGTITQDDGCVIYRPDSAPYSANGPVTRFQSAASWIDGIGVPYMGSKGSGYTPELAKNPVYIIEDLGSERPPGVGGLHESGNTGPNNGGQIDVHLYRITARATGGNVNVMAVVQSTFNAPLHP